MTNIINPAELHILANRLRDAPVNSSAGECFLDVLDNVADDIGTSNLDEVCKELASRGRQWPGYPDAPLICDVLVHPGGVTYAVWAFGCEQSWVLRCSTLCTLGDLLDTFEGRDVPEWFQGVWMKVYDESWDAWRPLWSINVDEPCLRVLGPLPQLHSLHGYLQHVARSGFSLAN